MPMDLIPTELRDRLLANGAEITEVDDHAPLVKLFTPDADACWLISELEPEDPDIGFGLCDLGLGSPELGYFRLSEIQSIRDPCGLPVSRDLEFATQLPLSVYAHAARKAGHIVLDEAAVAEAARALEQQSTALQQKFNDPHS